MDTVIQSALAEYSGDATHLLQILLAIQSRTPGRYVSKAVAMTLADALHIPLSRVYEVVTYYTALSDVPQGEHIIQICHTTVCNLNGYGDVVKWFSECLGIGIGETTPDGAFTLKLTACIGACDVAPAVKIGHNIYGSLTREAVFDIVKTLRGD